MDSPTAGSRCRFTGTRRLSCVTEENVASWIRGVFLRMDNYLWLFIFSLMGLWICCVVMNIYERETQRVAVVGLFSGIAVPTRVSADI